MTESFELEKKRLLPETAPSAPPVSDLLLHLRKHRMESLITLALNTVVAGIAAPVVFLALKVDTIFCIAAVIGLAFGLFCTLMMLITSTMQLAKQICASMGLRQGLNTPEQLFALACENTNLAAARALYATREIGIQALCGEALRLWTEKKMIKAAPRPWAPEAAGVLAWLLAEIAAKAPEQLWASTNPDWTELVMAWAAGSLALGPRWPGTAEAIFGSVNRKAEDA